MSTVSPLSMVDTPGGRTGEAGGIVGWLIFQHSLTLHFYVEVGKVSIWEHIHKYFYCTAGGPCIYPSSWQLVFGIPATHPWVSTGSILGGWGVGWEADGT